MNNITFLCHLELEKPIAEMGEPGHSKTMAWALHTAGLYAIVTWGEMQIKSCLKFARNAGKF